MNFGTRKVQVLKGLMQGRRHEGGGHFMFGPRLQHTSNIVFKKCPPFVVFAFQLRNPGDGTGLMMKIMARKKYKQHRFMKTS